MQEIVATECGGEERTWLVQGTGSRSGTERAMGEETGKEDSFLLQNLPPHPLTRFLIKIGERLQCRKMPSSWS